MNLEKQAEGASISSGTIGIPTASGLPTVAPPCEMARNLRMPAGGGEVGSIGEPLGTVSAPLCCREELGGPTLVSFVPNCLNAPIGKGDWGVVDEMQLNE